LSLAHSSCPFWGILASGQGAAVAALLLLTPEVSSPALRPAFFISIDAHESLLPHEEKLVEGLPCLHLLSVLDHERLAPDDGAQEWISKSPQLSIVRQFGGSVHRRTGGKARNHESHGKLSASEMNVIGRFLIEQKKGRRLQQSPCRFESTRYNDLRDKDETMPSPSPNTPHCLARDDESLEVWVLRSRLFELENSVSILIAQQIAANPPSSLMAVIQPNAIAGFNGNRRLRPGEGGGGAPCPSDFVLHREKRGSASDGANANESTSASRVHPSTGLASSADPLPCQAEEAGTLP
jgi:hypothetical protein